CTARARDWSGRYCRCRRCKTAIPRPCDAIRSTRAGRALRSWRWRRMPGSQWSWCDGQALAERGKVSQHALVAHLTQALVIGGRGQVQRPFGQLVGIAAQELGHELGFRARVVVVDADVLGAVTQGRRLELDGAAGLVDRDALIEIVERVGVL